MLPSVTLLHVILTYKHMKIIARKHALCAREPFILLQNRISNLIARIADFSDGFGKTRTAHFRNQFAPRASPTDKRRRHDFIRLARFTHAIIVNPRAMGPRGFADNRIPVRRQTSDKPRYFLTRR